MLLILFFVLCGVVAKICYDTYKTTSLSEELTEIRNAMAEESETDWSNGLLAENSDYAGWLKVYCTDIDGPVVLGESNETYLYRDFYGEQSAAGTLFFDETTDFSTRGNRIIYGHKMKDDTMFGTLDSFKSIDFFEECGYITLEEITGKRDYKAFAVMVIPGNADSEQFIDIQKWNNSHSERDRTEMLREIKDHASIYQEPFLTDETSFLFLITCDYTRTNGRLCVVAKSIDVEESAVIEK